MSRLPQDTKFCLQNLPQRNLFQGIPLLPISWNCLGWKTPLKPSPITSSTTKATTDPCPRCHIHTDIKSHPEWGLQPTLGNLSPFHGEILPRIYPKPALGKFLLVLSLILGGKSLIHPGFTSQSFMDLHPVDPQHKHTEWVWGRGTNRRSRGIKGRKRGVKSRDSGQSAFPGCS